MKGFIAYMVILCLAISSLQLSLYDKQDWTIVQLSSLNVQEKLSRHEDSKVDEAKIEQIRWKKLAKIAHYFGISSEGKSLEQLRTDIEQAKKDHPEKWEIYKAELHKRKLERLKQQ